MHINVCIGCEYFSKSLKGIDRCANMEVLTHSQGECDVDEHHGRLLSLWSTNECPFCRLKHQTLYSNSEKKISLGSYFLSFRKEIAAYLIKLNYGAL